MPSNRNAIRPYCGLVGAIRGFDKPMDIYFIIKGEDALSSGFALGKMLKDNNLKLEQVKSNFDLFVNKYLICLAPFVIFFGYKHQCENNLKDFKDCFIYG